MKTRILALTLCALTAPVVTPARFTGAATAPTLVRVCTSTWPGGWVDPWATGIRRAALLATDEWVNRFRRIGLHLEVPLNLSDTGQYGPDLGSEAKAAHACVARTDTFAYIGPMDGFMVSAAAPILNRAGMATISPSATLSGVTSPTVRRSFQPDTASHQLRYLTFYRVVSSDAFLPAGAAAVLATRFHARSYFLVRDVGQVPMATSAQIQDAATKDGLRIVGTAGVNPVDTAHVRASLHALTDEITAKNPDGVIYFSDTAGCYLLPAALRKAGYHGPIVENTLAYYLAAGGSGGKLTSLEAGLRGISHLFATIPGVDPAAGATSFRRAYLRRFGSAPPFYSDHAYDATEIALNSIYQATLHHTFTGSTRAKRVSVLPYVANTNWVGSTGRIGFDANGDVTHHTVSVFQIQGNRWSFVGLSSIVK